jgi:hypothetical protein
MIKKTAHSEPYPGRENSTTKVANAAQLVQYFVSN